MIFVGNIFVFLFMWIRECKVLQMTMHNMMVSWSKVIVKCGDQYEMDLRNDLLFYLNEWESNRFIMNISETFNRCDMMLCWSFFFFLFARLTHWIEILLLIDVPLKINPNNRFKNHLLYLKWVKTYSLFIISLSGIKCRCFEYNIQWAR